MNEQKKNPMNIYSTNMYYDHKNEFTFTIRSLCLGETL